MPSACLGGSDLIIPEVNCYSHKLSLVADLHPAQWHMIESLLHHDGLPFRDQDEVIRCGLAIGLYVLLQPQPDRAILAGAKANIDQDAEFERKKDCLTESVQKMLAAGQVDGAKRIVRVSLQEYQQIPNLFWRERWLSTIEAAIQVLRRNGIAFDAGLPACEYERAL